MSAIKVADLFAAVGVRFDPRPLDRLQQRLAHVKRQFLALRKVAYIPFAQSSQLANIRQMNTQLTRTLALARQIHAQGPISIRQSGGGGRGGGRRARATGGGSAFGGLASGFGLGRVPVFARNFFAGFTGAIAIRQLYEAQVAMDTIRVGIKATLRPGEQLADTFNFIRDSAAKLGFEFKSSAIQYTQLAASAKAANVSIADTRKIFIAAQTASRVFHLSVDDTEGVIKAFTQILSKGKIQAEELRNQLGDRLPAAVPLMAKALGVTTQQLNYMLQRGQILANDALPKLADTILKQYGGAVEEASHTAQANLNRFYNAWFFFKAQITASGIDDLFGLVLGGAAELLKTIIPIVKALARVLRALATPVHALFRIFDRLNHVFSGFSLHLIIAIGSVLGLQTALKKLNVQMLISLARWLVIGAVIAAILILIDDLATALEGGKSAIGEAAKSANPFIKTLADILLAIGGLVKFIAELIAFLVSGADNFDLISKKAKEFQDRIKAVIKDLGTLADKLSFGKLGEFGGWLGTKTQHIVQGTQEGLNSVFGTSFGKDFVAGGGLSSSVVSGRPSVNITGSPIQISVPPGGTNEDFVQRVKTVVDESNNTMLRQAQSQFGNQE